MSALVILACLVQTAERGPQTDARCNTEYVRELGASINHWAEVYDIPVVYEAAKIYHESRFKQRARGADGEIGLTQIKRHGAIQGRDLRLTRAQLEVVDKNVEIGTRYLASFVHECSHPSGWLTKYNRPARGCRTSRYSRGVIADLNRARAVRLDSARTQPSSEKSNWVPEPPAYTSYKQADSRRATTGDTRGSLPSGTDPTPRWVGQSQERAQELLAAPFAEP